MSFAHEALRGVFQRVFSVAPFLEYRTSRFLSHRLVSIRKGQVECRCYGHLFRLDLADWVDSWIFWESYEPACLEFLRSKVSEDAVVFDVGANVGLFSIISAGAGANVVAFEPSPDVAIRLRTNISLNSFGTKIKVEEAAVSDGIGEATLFADPRTETGTRKNEGLGSLAQANVQGSAGFTRSFRVKKTTVDAYVEENRISRLDFIKMDIQGAEYLALCGAKRTLRELRPTILMEWDLSGAKAFGWDASKLAELLQEVGYSQRSLDDSNAILEPL